MDQTRQKIRGNRLKARMSIKDMYVKENENGRAAMVIEPENVESTAARRRRKTSQAFRSFECLSTLNDKFIHQSFETLFKKLQKIGEGAQSQVYKCLEIETGNIYAVKIVKKKDLEIIESMRQCYEVLKQLNHQCIISGKYLFLDEKKMTCHLVEQLGQHSNLRNFINRHFQKVPKEKRVGVIEEGQIADILKNLFEALAYMREKGVCHRDIKPENILYDRISQELKIIDFQLARMQRYTHQKLLLMSHVGTLHYRAPESFSAAYGVEVDIWAVGMIAFEMLTGTLPFKSSSHQDTIDLICQSEIDYVQFDLPKSTQTFLSKLLEKDPSRRMTPKQALACPFMLKYMTQTCDTVKLKKASSFDQVSDSSSSSSESRRCMTPSRCYEMNSQFSFSDTISQDMGVRFCNQ